MVILDALVAPVVAYVPEGNIDPPESHMRFPGTIHLPEEYFKKLLEYASRSFKQHGFTDIVLIGDSGPNAPISPYIKRGFKKSDLIKNNQIKMS